MTQHIEAKLKALMHQYPKPKDLIMGYGTAGFRARADQLPWVMIRVGILAAFRSKVKQGEVVAIRMINTHAS